MRPHLGQVERIESVGLGVLVRHDLHMQRPTRMIAALDRVVKVASMVIAILAGEPVGLRLSEEIDPLVGLEMVFHPKSLALGVNPHIGVAGVAVHVPPGLGNAAITHQPGDLVGRLRRQAPEVPLHVMVTQVSVCTALLGADEVLELHRVTNEEHRRVVPDHVIVAFAGIKLQRETTRVSPGVGTAAFTGNGRKTHQHVRLGARLKHRRLGVLADVVCHLEVPKGAPAFGMRLALGYPFPVEIRHLFDEVVILQQDRTVRPDGKRVFIAGYGNPCIGCGGFATVFRHDDGNS